MCVEGQSGYTVPHPSSGGGSYLIVSLAIITEGIELAFFLISLLTLPLLSLQLPSHEWRGCPSRSFALDGVAGSFAGLDAPVAGSRLSQVWAPSSPLPGPSPLPPPLPFLLILHGSPASSPLPPSFLCFSRPHIVPAWTLCSSLFCPHKVSTFSTTHRSV